MYIKSLSLASLILLIACKSRTETKASANKWSEKERQEFISSCMDQGKKQNLDDTTSKRYCECMLDRFQQAFKSQKEAINISLNEMAVLSRECID